MITMRRILFIAYHFPPFFGSSGYLRTLKFVKYLPQFGFEPIVLSVNTRAYQTIDETLLEKVPLNTRVIRAFGLDASKDLSIKGRYPGFFAVPDRWSSWIPAAIFRGIRLVKKYNIDIVFSTHPIPSAHMIAERISHFTKKPWVADFRDQMWDDCSPHAKKHFLSRKNIEQRTIKNATKVVVTTNGIRDLYLRRYGQIVAPAKIKVINNGFDESDFAGIVPSNGQAHFPLHLIHAGLLEPADRNPLPFFHAIKIIVQKEKWKGALKVDLIAPGNYEAYRQKVDELALADYIHILPPVPYHQALQKMADADILLLFQGESCNPQIPAKVFEYLRIGKPVFALTPPDGQTAKLISESKAGIVVDPDHQEKIADSLLKWLIRLRKGEIIVNPSSDVVANYSRKHQTFELALCFRDIIK